MNCGMGYGQLVSVSVCPSEDHTSVAVQGDARMAWTWMAEQR